MLNTNQMNANKQPLLFLVAILLITFFVYFPSLFNSFVDWDDNSLILQNGLVQQAPLSNIVQIFTSHVAGRYYPLAVFIHQLEYHFFQFQPFFYHMINLLIHLCNITLLFYILQSLVKNTRVSLLTCLLFAIHPLNVESVAWISSLKDVLFTFFYLSALYCYIKSKQSRLVFHLTLTLALFLLSLLTKSMAVTFPLALILINIFLKDQMTSKDLRNLLPFFALSLLFGYLTLHFAETAKAFPSVRQLELGLLDRFWLSGFALILYIFKLLLPIHLSVIYPLPDKAYGLYLPIVYIAATLCVCLILVLFISYKKSSQRRIFYPIIFFAFSLFPVLHFIKINTGLIYERFAYLPSIGFLLCFTSLYYYVLDKILADKNSLKALARTVMIAYILFLCALSWQRCFVWQNSFALWNDAISKFPSSPNGYINRAVSFLSVKEFDQALNDVQTAIQLTPDNSSAYLVRASILSNLKMFDQAIADYSKALEIELIFAEDTIKALNNRGNLYSRKGQYKLAIADYNTILEMSPTNIYALLNRGIVHYKEEEWASALNDFRKILKHYPNHYYATQMEKLVVLKLTPK